MRGVWGVDGRYFGLAHPLRVCTRLLKVWPYGPGVEWDAGDGRV